MESLMLCVENLESQHRLYAANLLIQLDVLVSLDISITLFFFLKVHSQWKIILLQENLPSRSRYSEAAIRVLLGSMSTEVDQSAAFILSNLGGTYAWTGEPYTIAWLMKKAGLTSPHHRNMIKDFDWEDQSLQVNQCFVLSSASCEVKYDTGYLILSSSRKGKWKDGRINLVHAYLIRKV